MLDALQQQLLATLTTPRATQPLTDLDITSSAVWKLLAMLMEESIVHTNATPGPAWLDWQFGADSAPSHSYEVDALAAGTYQLAGQTNCAHLSVAVNGSEVTLPFTTRVGEQLTLTIERAAPGVATVQLVRIGTYRQLVAEQAV